MPPEQTTPNPTPKDVTAPKEDAAASLPRVRTYAADMSAVIKKRGETLASIVNKEHVAAQRRGSKTTAARSPKKIALIIGASFLVLLGVGMTIAAFVFTSGGGVPVNERAIIFPNTTEEVAALESTKLADQLANVRGELHLSLGEIAHVVVTEADMVVPTATLAEKLSLPDDLARQVDDIMIGVHSFDRNQPFIILHVATYDRSFGAMLAWEREMGRTLDSFFAPINSTSSDAPALSFTDNIIRNLDVRRSEDSWPILYTFPAQNLIIITTNEFTLREIMTRLGASESF